MMAQTGERHPRKLLREGRTAMAKNIVFCADGTWNGPGESDTDDPTAPWTNVFKLFLNLAGENDPGSTTLGKEQERSYSGPEGNQIAKYLDGVGDSTNELDKLIGGGFGAGLITRVVRGYTFVSRNYAAGDKIYLVGFSRGAYTARALAGLISDKGLLTAAAVDFADTGAAYRAGAAVWLQWRRDVRLAKGLPIDTFEAAMLDLPGFLFRPPPLNTLTPAPIEAVAVWDTVGALGIPVFTGQHVDVDFFQFADTRLSDNINHARHTVAIDEQREDFTPTLWDPDPARIQVLFPGAHADVGGGYPLGNDESGLSDGALVWMTEELTKLGVLFNATPQAAPKPDPAGAAHEPWNSGLFKLLPQHARTLPDGLGLSRTVIARMNAGLVYPDPSALKIDYRPSNIADYLNGLQPAAGVVPV
jgi:Uncharacterized alpha/beta hydrolase domain (DUF2235)